MVRAGTLPIFLGAGGYGNGPSDFIFFGKIGEDRIIVIAVRRRGKTPALPWIQRVDAELRHRGIVVNAKKIRRLTREHTRQ